MDSKEKLAEQVDAAEDRWKEAWKRGPTRLRWDAVPVQVGDLAPDLTLSDSRGDQTRLSSLWADGPALILFWRHYGCGCGIERAARLRQEDGDYVSAGAKVAVIGQAEPDRSAAYAAKYELPGLVLCDPDQRAYQAYGVLEGKPSQIVFDASDEFLRRDYNAGVGLAKTRRDAGRPFVDSPWLLPAEFVIDRSGTIRLAYRYQYCEDFPNPLVLVAGIKEAAAAQG
jgi:peroxiredoxin